MSKVWHSLIIVVALLVLLTPAALPGPLPNIALAQPGNFYLTTNSTGGGNVTVPCDNCTTGPYANSTVVELRALPDIGYMFVNWTGNTSTIGNVNCSVTTITMLANYTVTANFAAVPAPTSACYYMGGNSSSSSASWGYKGNKHTFGGSYTLTEIQQGLSFTGARNLSFFVMYNATGGTTFTQVLCLNKNITGTGQAMYSSGNISVPVNSTGQWWIGVAWNGSTGPTVTYYYGGSEPYSWGSGPINGTLVTASRANDQAPCASPLTPTDSSTPFEQRLCLQTVVVDTYPPAAVVNLIATVMNSTAVNLTWTAPGDDGMNGTAASYDIRYSTSTINESNWAAATQATGEPAPATAGTSQSFIVGSLTPGTPYYFDIKTSDEVPNTACLSNVASATPSAGTSDITGMVYEANASVVPSANVTLSGPEAKNTTTNATGYYSFTVGATGNYTVNVTKGGFFSPVQKQINVTVPNPVSCNFTGMDAPYRTAPDGYYCTKCSNLWLMGGFYPVEFRLNATRVSDVLYAWTHPS